MAVFINNSLDRLSRNSSSALYEMLSYHQSQPETWYLFMFKENNSIMGFNFDNIFSAVMNSYFSIFGEYCGGVQVGGLSIKQ